MNGIFGFVVSTCLSNDWWFALGKYVGIDLLVVVVAEAMVKRSKRSNDGNGVIFSLSQRK